MHRKQCPSERIAWAKSKLLISFSCILFLGKHTSHIICCLASIGMSVASVLSSPKVYCIERPSLESEQQNEEVGEPYRYSVMNTTTFQGPSFKTSRRSFFFSRNLSIGGAQPSFKPQSPARDVKPFSMSSTRPVDPGGKGNPLIESILDAVPLAYLFSQCNPAGAWHSILSQYMLLQGLRVD